MCLRKRRLQKRDPLSQAPGWRGQALRRALFATLARLFTNGDPKHIDLERGKFNWASTCQTGNAHEQILRFLLVYSRGMEGSAWYVAALARSGAGKRMWHRSPCLASPGRAILESTVPPRLATRAPIERRGARQT